MVKAAGIASGEFSGRQQAAGNPTFEVPAIFANDVCFAFQSDVSANCLSLSGDTESIPVPSSAASYPPLSHVVFAIPLFFSDGVGSLYLMRLFGLLACAFFFALGIDVFFSKKTHPAGSVAIALVLTPMVLSLCATVNPSGLAISSAFATWTGAIALTRQDAISISSISVVRFLLPFAFFLAIRRDSLIWGAAMMLCLLVLLTSSQLAAISKAAVTWVLAPVVLVELFLHVYVWGGPNGQGIAESGSILGSSSTGNVRAAFDSLPTYFNQAIGVLGWLDTVLPSYVYIFWGALFIGSCLFAFSNGESRIRASLFICFALFIAIPVKVGASTFPYLQGRYTLPLLIGAPIVASLVFQPGRNTLLGDRRSTMPLTIILWILGVLSFSHSLRRFSTGLSSPWTSLLDPHWNSPILTTRFLIVTYPIILGALLAWLALVSSRPTRLNKAE